MKILGKYGVQNISKFILVNHKVSKNFRRDL